jgi:uncharacterized ParB-like nuclease family protein
MVRVQEIPIAQIRRPLPRQTDRAKVKTLMESIAKEGLRILSLGSRKPTLKR